VDFEGIWEKKLSKDFIGYPRIWGQLKAQTHIKCKRDQCYDHSKKVTLNVHPHELIYNNGLHDFYFCDVCNPNQCRKDDVLKESYRCPDCDFDVCLSCVEKNVDMIE